MYLSKDNKKIYNNTNLLIYTKYSKNVRLPKRRAIVVVIVWAPLRVIENFCLLSPLNLYKKKKNKVVL